ncbi:MAG: hypothetical protein KC591_04680 [Gemmatimonadetes bacterium]|nr:hypothetical protein [Gemmatimonadota bacterium]
MRRRTFALAVTLAVVLGGCGSSERSLRFDAERARYWARRDETSWRAAGLAADSLSARVARRNAEIEQEFGAAGAPGIAELRDPDTVARLRLAAESGLLATDLRASKEATEEIAGEYDRIGRIYRFDPDVRARASLGAGKVWERLGQGDRALDVYRAYLGRDGRPTTGIGPVDRVEAFDVDLEIHVALLARELRSRGEAETIVREVRDRLRRTAELWADRTGVSRVKRRLAEANALMNDQKAAREGFEEVLRDAAPGDDRAEVLLALGMLAADARQNTDAETWWREALREGDEIPAAAEARVRLGELLVETRRPRDGLEVIDGFLALGARVREGRESEALYWKGQAFIARGQWEDALPVLREAALREPGAAHALPAAGVYRSRLTRLRAGPQAGDQLVVKAAEADPGIPPEIRVPRTWESDRRRERLDEFRQQGLRVLRTVAESAADPDLRERARAQLDRLRAVFKASE